MAKKRRILISDQLRRAIDDSGLTRYRIAKESGISQTAITLFYNGQRGLSSKALDKLGACLDLQIVLGRKEDAKGK